MKNFLLIFVVQNEQEMLVIDVLLFILAFIAAIAIIYIAIIGAVVCVSYMENILKKIF